MNRKKFGLLIKTLRRELSWYQRKLYTQADLAQQANATPKIISNLERGIKAHLETELLLGLADAFDLTTRERAAFFECAGGLRQRDIPRPGCDPDAVLNDLFKTLRQYRLPAFIVDDYDNIVAANSLILHLFSAAQPLINNASQKLGGYNVIRLVFSSESPFAASIVQNRDTYLLQTIYFFRFITLRRRVTQFYQDMMDSFFIDPEMERFRQVYAKTFQRNGDFFFENNFAALNLPANPPLHIFSPPYQIVNTLCGALYLIAYVPADMPTSQYFTHLAQTITPNVHPLST